MAETYNISNNRKKQRLKINNLEDLKKALVEEGYKKANLEDSKLKTNIAKDFKIDNSVVDMIYKSLEKSDVTYRANNVIDFIEYMENIKEFEREYHELSKEINQINKLSIDRVEYERILTTQDDVSHMIEDIEKIKQDVSRRMEKKDIYRLENIEKELSKEHIYSKDIELLKKIVSSGGKVEKYDDETRTKTILIDIPDEMNFEYIPAQIGSIEYHNHIKSNIPRMKRLRKNMKKYMIANSSDEKYFNINQSETLQDTINIAVAVYDNKEFKAISGSNEVDDFCKSPEVAEFESSKVNKLGKLGIGYNRVNDSEKKIFEEIHKQIESGDVKSYGNLVLYSKWEPCPSCFYVISQFCKKHPNINIEVKYSREYGE